MNICRGELTEMEQELLRLRRDSNAKSSQLVQMEETLQETKGLLDKKSEMGKLHCCIKFSFANHHQAAF